MSAPHSDPLAHPEVQQGNALRYISGFITTLLLMFAALMLTIRQHLPYVSYAEAVTGLAVLSLVTQATLFFGLDISRAHIWKSLSLLLTIPLFIISVGLTVWMFQSLATRTMLMPAGMLQQPTLLQ
jgi:cytochrome o ubiquinol oxidase operon protein cyoD